MDLVHDLYEERDPNLILLIPLNRREEDIWFWSKERSRNYSVKSAYHWLQSQKHNFNMGDNDRCWKRMWTLKVPLNVKHMVWRAAIGCLPIKIQLQSKQVNIDNFCPQCQVELESIVHALVTCSFAREYWTQLNGYDVSYVQSHTSFLDWMISTFDTWSSEKRGDAAMLCCSLWKGRNELVWKQKSRELREVVAFARVALNQ